MKTLLVTLDFPPLLGGIANYYHNLVKKMPPQDIVVLMNKEKRDEIRNKNYEFKIYYKKFFTKLIWPHWLPLIWQTYSIARKEKIKMMWVGQVLPVGSAVYVVSKLLHIPYYVSCHGTDISRAKTHPRKFKLAKKILSDAEYVTANTEYTKNILVRNYHLPEDKVIVVYPETSLGPSQVDKNKVNELKNKYNLHNKKVLLTVGRLVKSKGIDSVIKALPKTLEQIPNLIYMIVGDGPDMERLVETRHGVSLQDKIIFTGAVPYDELVNYYALADLFILTPRRRYVDVSPSKTTATEVDIESFGIVYLEALKFDLPVIAGDVGGVQEIANSSTFQREVSGGVNKINLVDSENIDEIAKKIISIL